MVTYSKYSYSKAENFFKNDVLIVEIPPVGYGCAVQPKKEHYSKCQLVQVIRKIF